MFDSGFQVRSYKGLQKHNTRRWALLNHGLPRNAGVAVVHVTLLSVANSSLTALNFALGRGAAFSIFVRDGKTALVLFPPHSKCSFAGEGRFVKIPSTPMDFKVAATKTLLKSEDNKVKVNAHLLSSGKCKPLETVMNGYEEERSRIEAMQLGTGHPPATHASTNNPTSPLAHCAQIKST
ncbi:hypothetical protein TNCV_215261 [Trichonephila clavipes]|nr:hypothetical protein TNCV_215261 [Trichonephila clavipes]